MKIGIYLNTANYIRYQYQLHFSAPLKNTLTGNISVKSENPAMIYMKILLKG